MGQVMELKNVEASNADFEPHSHGTLTPEEEINCHKARIFSVLTNAPVIRAWKHAVCDGAVYLGKGYFPKSYADRYFQTSSEDISFVTFSIVTAFEGTAFDADGHETERFQCHLSPAQRKASEFLIVTFSKNHDRVALLPRRLYWPDERDPNTSTDEDLPDDRSLASYPSYCIREASSDETSVEGAGSTSPDKVPPSEIAASILSKYSFSINFLLANIDEIKRITNNPMHPTTTPFQLGLDGIIPRAGVPKAIMPQASERDLDEMHEENKSRFLHSHIPRRCPAMRFDFLDYQPLMRDFKIIISNCEVFPSGLEAVVSYSFGRHFNLEKSGNVSHLKYADYLLTHGITPYPEDAWFIPRRLIQDHWFIAPGPKESIPSDIYDNGRRVHKKEFRFEIDNSGKWVSEIWKIISKFPPGERPTRAEEKQEAWKKAVPWPEIEAQVDLQKAPTPQKARRDDEQRSTKHDSGMGDHVAVKPSDVCLLAAHYMDKASLDDNEATEDAT